MSNYLFELPSGKATLIAYRSSGAAEFLTPMTRKETDSALHEALILLHKQKVLLTELAKAKEKLLAIQVAYTSHPACAEAQVEKAIKLSFKES